MFDDVCHVQGLFGIRILLEKIVAGTKNTRSTQKVFNESVQYANSYFHFMILQSVREFTTNMANFPFCAEKTDSYTTEIGQHNDSRKSIYGHISVTSSCRFRLILDALPPPSLSSSVLPLANLGQKKKSETHPTYTHRFYTILSHVISPTQLSHTQARILKLH